MGKYYEVKGKSSEKILEEMTNLEADVGSPVLEMQKAAIAVRVAGQIHDAIAKATEDFIRMTGELARKTDDLKGSIDQFRKSTERSSKALNWFTLVIAATGLLNLGLLIYRAICP
jgi:hypothetical protein